MAYNPYDNVLATVEKAAKILGYTPEERFSVTRRKNTKL